MIEVNDLGRCAEELHEDFYDSVVMQLRSLGWAIHRLRSGHSHLDKAKRVYFLELESDPAFAEGTHPTLKNPQTRLQNPRR